MQEIWKDVKNYEGYYEISNTGKIASKERTCIDTLDRKRVRNRYLLSPNINNGYYRVTLCKNGRKTIFSIHRLVATHFIENPNNLPQVNHINGNKLDNRVENLEWVTVKENVIHAYKNGLIHHIKGENHPNYGKCGGLSKKAKKVVAENIKSGEIRKYNSIIETEKDGFDRGEVSKCCNGKVKQHKGYRFIFEI